MFYIILTKVDLENVYSSVVGNLRGVCEDIDCRRHVSYLRL